MGQYIRATSQAKDESLLKAQALKSPDILRMSHNLQLPGRGQMFCLV